MNETVSRCNGVPQTYLLLSVRVVPQSPTRTYTTSDSTAGLKMCYRYSSYIICLNWQVPWHYWSSSHRIVSRCLHLRARQDSSVFRSPCSSSRSAASASGSGSSSTCILFYLCSRPAGMSTALSSREWKESWQDRLKCSRSVSSAWLVSAIKHQFLLLPESARQFLK